MKTPALLLASLLLIVCSTSSGQSTTKTKVTQSETRALAQAIQDEIYDYEYQGHYFPQGGAVGDALSDSKSRVPVYIDPLLEDGEGRAIYKLMPYGEVLRLFHAHDDGTIVLDGDPEVGFPATQPNRKTVYLKDSEVFHCPMDKGKISEDCCIHPQTTLLPSCWETRGYSYEMNYGAPDGIPIPSTLMTNAGTIFRHSEGWVPDTTRFILFYEPPASPQVCPHTSPPCTGAPHFPPQWYQWHRNRGRTSFTDPRIAPGNLFISPILFVDGHTRILNFSKSLTTDPYYPFEQTSDWMWYKDITMP